MQDEEESEVLSKNTLMARVTPLTSGTTIDVSKVGGKTKVSWRSVTQVLDFTMKAPVAIRVRTIVFRAMAVPSLLGDTLTQPDSPDGEYGRPKLSRVSEMPSWVALLFRGQNGTAIMKAKPSGPGVTVLSTKEHTATSTEAGKFVQFKTPTDLGATLTYNYQDPTSFEDAGVGGLGPAYMLELIQVGFPSEESVGSFKLEGDKKSEDKMDVAGKNIRKVPPVSSFASSGAGAAVVEMRSTIKVYHY